MNRKYTLKNRRRFYTFIMLVTITLSCTFLAATVNGADTADTFKTVVVEKGDTLWSIANENCRGGDIRKYIHDIKETNGLNDSVIFEGEALKLPL